MSSILAASNDTPPGRLSLAGGLALGLASGGLGAAAPGRGLSNPRASNSARDLYAFLWSVYGRNTLTGQQELGTAKGGPAVELD